MTPHARPRSPFGPAWRLVLLAGSAGVAMLLASLPSRSETMAVQDRQTPAPAIPDGSGPQTAVPAPRLGGRADTPGGSARNGVIRPPPTGGSTPVIRPRTNGAMPVIPPPGTPGNQSNVQPR